MRKHWLLTAVLSMSALALAQQQNPPAQNPAASNPPTQDQLDAKTRKIMDDAAKKGHPLTVVGALRDKVSVEAVLLPYDVSRHVFGREVADNYAAVEITVSNHNPDASLIVHTVYVDYSQWALSGFIYLKQARDAQQERARKAAEQAKNTTGTTGSSNQQPLQTETTDYEAETKANQIASVEYRAVRGQALDAQPWTKRNITIRALRLAGSIASAYSFVTRDQDIVHGITAFAGQVVPGAETFWPDGTVDQMNRISDLGFKVNKVIPKNASDVIVAFFPLDRFLTPGLKAMFKKSPALFFAPYALAFDHEARKQFRPIFADFLGSPQAADAFLREMPLVYMCDYLNIVNATELTHEDVSKCLEKIHKELPPAAAQGQATTSAPIPTATPAQGQATTGAPISTATPAQAENPLSDQDQVVITVMKFLSHASLNTVRVVVGGDYTVNVNDIPAMVNAVELDGGPVAWNSSGDKTGILRGSFLATGAPQIVEADKLGISNLAATDATSDSILKFKMTLKNPIAPGTTVTFRVDKTNEETKKTVQGVPSPFQVPKLAEGTELSLGNVFANDDATVRITGANFSDTTKVLLFSDPTKVSDPAKADVTLSKNDAKSIKSDEIVIDLCQVKSFDFDKTWTVKVQDGAQIAHLSPTFKPSAAAKNKCAKPAGGSSATQPQGTVKGPAAGGSPAPTPATKPKPNGGGKQQKKGSQ